MLGYSSLASCACACRNAPSPITSAEIPNAIMATIFWPIWFIDSSWRIKRAMHLNGALEITDVRSLRASLEESRRRPKIGTPSANLPLHREAKGLGLEENLQRKLQRSSFAREHRTKVVEDAALRFKGVARRTGNALGSHRVGRSTERTGASTRGAAWNKLWMVQQVEGLHSELNSVPLGDREALDRRGVEVVRRGSENGIAAGIRQGAVVGLDVFRVGIECGVTHDVADSIHTHRARRRRAVECRISGTKDVRL